MPSRGAAGRTHHGRSKRLSGAGSRVGKLQVLGRLTTNVVPWSLGSDEDMHLQLHARVAVDSTERYPVHLSFMHPAERGAAAAAKAQAPAGSGLVASQVVFARRPVERSR